MFFSTTNVYLSIFVAQLWNSKNIGVESEHVNDRFKLIQGARRDVRNLFAWERTVKRDANLWRKSCCDVTGRGSRRKRMSVTFPYFRTKCKEFENKRNALFCNQLQFLDRKGRRNLDRYKQFRKWFCNGLTLFLFFFFRELALIRNCVRMKKNEVNFDRFLYAKKLLTQSYLNILFETILNSSNSWKISIHEKLNEIFFLHSKIVSAYNI